jgi:hypothetical protein
MLSRVCQPVPVSKSFKAPGNKSHIKAALPQQSKNQGQHFPVNEPSEIRLPPKIA